MSGVPAGRVWVHAALLTALCALVYLPGLGSTGLSMSEGHRAIPAWEMLGDARAGDTHWFEPRMFGTMYLRKPPGALWAIAGVSAVLGETELAARLPGALASTLLALGVFAFSVRWFGAPWALAGGAVQALLPVMVPGGRSAEIEPLHAAGVGLVCLAAIDLGTARARLWVVALAATGACAAALVKGPAGLPVMIGAIVGPAIVGRSARRGVTALTSVALGLVLAWVTLGSFRDAMGRPGAVTQGAGEFLWRSWGGVLVLVPATLASLLPASLALVFPWGRKAKEEAGASEYAARQVLTARALAWSVVSALVVMAAGGVDNPRYALPVCALVTPLTGYVARGAWGGLFGARRASIARAMMLGRPWAWIAALLAGALVRALVVEPRASTSGREAGIALAAHLPDGAEVWGDELIEARPEVLWYARREAASQGRTVRVRWVKGLGSAAVPTPPGVLLALRSDGLVDECSGWVDVEEIARGAVYKYRYVLCAPGSNGSGPAEDPP